MIRWHCLLPAEGGETMPEFTTVSVQEAMVRTIPGRQESYINVYLDYIQQLPKGQAGRLRGEERENPLTIRRRLVSAAQMLGIHLTIKRSGSDVYFWREDGEQEQPRRRRGRRARRQEETAEQYFSETEAGVQERTQEETTAPDQPFSVSEEVAHEAALEEESPELGQTPV
jgi:hypothetical protein